MTPENSLGMGDRLGANALPMHIIKIVPPRSKGFVR